VSSHSGVCGGAPAAAEIKIGVLYLQKNSDLIATISLIFLRISWPNLSEFKLALMSCLGNWERGWVFCPHRLSMPPVSLCVSEVIFKQLDTCHFVHITNFEFEWDMLSVHVWRVLTCWQLMTMEDLGLLRRHDVMALRHDRASRTYSDADSSSAILGSSYSSSSVYSLTFEDLCVPLPPGLGAADELEFPDVSGMQDQTLVAVTPADSDLEDATSPNPVCVIYLVIFLNFQSPLPSTRFLKAEI